jgi:hypothetical protein
MQKIWAVLLGVFMLLGVLSLAGLAIDSCFFKDAREQTEIDINWRPLVEKVLVNGYNPAQVIESTKVYTARSMSSEGRFGGSYVALYLSDRIAEEFSGGSQEGNPLDHPRQLHYERYMGKGKLNLGVQPIPSDLYADGIKDAKTLIVIREHQLRAWVWAYRGGSPLYNDLTDWYVTFIDLASRKVSPTVKFSGKERKIDDDKEQEMRRVVQLLNPEGT